MSFQQAIEAAGATVHEFKEFGSYQGDWYALVTVNGEKGWVHGSYGSCSGCDSFEAEFGRNEEACDEHSYNPQKDCSPCAAKTAEHNKRLADFGRGYIEPLHPVAGLLAELDKQSEWDSDSKEAADWIRSIEATHQFPVVFGRFAP